MTTKKTKRLSAMSPKERQAWCGELGAVIKRGEKAITEAKKAIDRPDLEKS